MVNLASFWSTLTTKNKSVIHTQLAPQRNNFPDHEISVQSDKKIRLVSESRLQSSLEKRIRSTPNPILLGLGSSCWPALVLLDGKIQFCCTVPSMVWLRKRGFVLLFLVNLMPKCGRKGRRLCAGAEKFLERPRHRYIISWPLEFVEQSTLIDLACHRKVKWADRIQDTLMGKHCLYVSVLKSHIKPERDNAQRPTQV